MPALNGNVREHVVREMRQESPPAPAFGEPAQSHIHREDMRCGFPT
jgi:hypothetical protein